MKREKWAFVSACVILREGDEILLEKRVSGRFAGFWCLPGGHINAGETVRSAAKREVLEETGLRIGKLKLLSIVDGKRFPGCESVMFVLGAKITGGRRKLQPEEVAEAEFFPLARLPRKMAFDHRIAILRALRPKDRNGRSSLFAQETENLEN